MYPVAKHKVQHAKDGGDIVWWRDREMGKGTDTIVSCPLTTVSRKTSEARVQPPRKQGLSRPSMGLVPGREYDVSHNVRSEHNRGALSESRYDVDLSAEIVKVGFPMLWNDDIDVAR